jgi:CubicO group peptidase (beta-lactamase class C family)
MLSCASVIGAIGCTRADVIDTIVRDRMAQERIPGAAIAVLKAGQIVKVGAYGLTGTNRPVPTTPDSIFRIQSATKPFTAVGTMMLVEAGQVGLDDPITKYVSGCPDSWRTITVRHLLSHTSGLRDFVNEPTIDLSVEATDEQLLASVASHPLAFEPGASWSYNSTNYLLLGMIIRRVTGRWYGDFLSQHIFQPLGMTHTSISRDRATAVKGYVLDSGRAVPSSADTMLAMSVLSYAGGGIQSTALDLGKWDRALDTEQLLKRSTLEQMWTPVKLNNGATYPYGLGWNVTEIAQHRRIWHTGVWTGFAAIIDRFVDDRLTVIVLANLSEAKTAALSRAIAATYVPALGVRIYQPIADGQPALTSRLKDVVRRAADGRLREADFTATAWRSFGPQVDQIRQSFGALGELQDLTLIERAQSGSDRSYRYQARFANSTMILHFVLTVDDRISAMAPEQIEH